MGFWRRHEEVRAPEQRASKSATEAEGVYPRGKEPGSEAPLVGVPGQPYFKMGYTCQQELNEDGAIKWYTLAAEEGHREATYQLSQLMFARHDPEALHWFIRSAELCHPMAAASLASAAYESRDLTKAFYWHEKAAKGGDSDSMGIFAIHRLTLGDEELGGYWLRKAAEAGNTEAIKLLQEIPRLRRSSGR